MLTLLKGVLSMGRKSQFSEEFKINAVATLLESDKSTLAVAQSLGVGLSTLERWKAIYADTVRKPRGQNVKADDKNHKENLQLRKRIRQLEMENSILKKAAAFFAKEQLNSELL